MVRTATPRDTVMDRWRCWRTVERRFKEPMFLAAEELTHLKLHFATSSWDGRRKLPLAFTEHGAIMAATVLNSPRAVEMSVYSSRKSAKRFEPSWSYRLPGCLPTQSGSHDPICRSGARTGCTCATSSAIFEPEDASCGSAIPAGDSEIYAWTHVQSRLSADQARLTVRRTRLNGCRAPMTRRSRAGAHPPGRRFVSKNARDARSRASHETENDTVRSRTRVQRTETSAVRRQKMNEL